MGLRQCEKCSEMVDEAKAFCPGCGHAFVEEEKRQKSEFERLDSTVQLGHTMYNQMLSDMGLNVSKTPATSDKRVEVVVPAVAETVSKPTEPSASARTEAAPEPAPVRNTDEAKKSGRAKWIVLAIIGFILLLPPALISTIALIFQILSRYR
jgi:hypothetical protein